MVLNGLASMKFVCYLAPFVVRFRKNIIHGPRNHAFSEPLILTRVARGAGAWEGAECCIAGWTPPGK